MMNRKFDTKIYKYDNINYNMKTKCQYCKHEWESRVEFPLACPKCKRYLPLKQFEEQEDETR